jgi:hypothetical protein
MQTKKEALFFSTLTLAIQGLATVMIYSGGRTLELGRFLIAALWIGMVPPLIRIMMRMASGPMVTWMACGAAVTFYLFFLTTSTSDKEFSLVSPLLWAFGLFFSVTIAAINAYLSKAVGVTQESRVMIFAILAAPQFCIALIATGLFNGKF